jgi:hypothetical protein
MLLEVAYCGGDGLRKASAWPSIDPPTGARLSGAGTSRTFPARPPIGGRRVESCDVAEVLP